MSKTKRQELDKALRTLSGQALKMTCEFEFYRSKASKAHNWLIGRFGVEKRRPPVKVRAYTRRAYTYFTIDWVAVCRKIGAPSSDIKKIRKIAQNCRSLEDLERTYGNFMGQILDH